MAIPTQQRVRIIGGTHRGRIVRFPATPGLRPTPDRVRETLFNWLGQDLTGRSTLEPFAGSGVMSLEALSRRAKLAVAVDRDRRAVSALEKTAQEFGATGLEAHVADAGMYMARETRAFDVIFLDPPFADDGWEELLKSAAARLAPDGRIYAEAGRAIAPPAGLELVREGRAGQVHYHLLAPC
jgi:16S rRNA (guanine966-N2)-methyltransferase